MRVTTNTINMNLNIITPENKELNFEIEDFAPISENKETTEIMLILLEEDQTKMLANTLEYHSIKTYKTSDLLGVIVDKPKKLRATTTELTLNYFKN